jgi:TolA-binding protein
MTNSTNRIFDSGECLSLEEMQAYIDGSLSGAALNRVERHLLDCEMCEDALEGLKNSPNATANIEFIDDAIDRMTESKPKVIFPWKIAAAFALIFASTLTLWLVIPKGGENKLAEKTVTQEQQLINSDQSVAPEPAQATAADPIPQPQSQSSASSEAPLATSYSAISKNQEVRDEVVAYKEVLTEEITRTDDAKNSAAGISSDLAESVPPAAAPAEVSKKTTSTKYKEEQSLKRESENISAAKVFEKGEVTTSATKDYKANQGSDNLYLTAAITQIENGDYKGAEKNLKKYLLLDSPKKDQAYWYLSKVYLHYKDTKKAKEMLNAVIKENKAFMKEAQEELSKLQ